MFKISRWAAVPSWGLEDSPASSRRFALPRDGVLRVDAGGGTVVLRCEAGTILVTRAGDLEDHVLEAGGRLALRPRDAGVAWAFTDAVAVVEAVEAERHVATRWLRGLRRRADGPALVVGWLALAAAFLLSIA